MAQPKSEKWKNIAFKKKKNGRGDSYGIEMFTCIIVGIKYHSMSIHDNVDAKDDGAQIKRFVEASDVINDILKQV